MTDERKPRDPLCPVKGMTLLPMLAENGAPAVRVTIDWAGGYNLAELIGAHGPGPVVALAIRVLSDALEATRQSADAAELVWTGPTRELDS